MGGNAWEKDVEAGGRGYTVTAPTWASWQVALDAASTADGPNPQLLLEECLLVCLRTEDGRRLSRSELRGLSAQDGDRLLSTALMLIDEQRDSLNAQVAQEEERIVIQTHAGKLQLRAWTFGERNEALRRSLRLQSGKVTHDLSHFERELVACCVTAEGDLYADPAQWPVPLGEIVMQELDALNGLAVGEAEMMAACLRTGVEHPDLALIRLCRVFGLSPEQMQQMNARTGERLLAGLQLLEQPASPAVQPVHGSYPDGEGVTRILVHDA